MQCGKHIKLENRRLLDLIALVFFNKIGSTTCKCAYLIEMFRAEGQSTAWALEVDVSDRKQVTAAAQKTR